MKEYMIKRIPESTTCSEPHCKKGFKIGEEVLYVIDSAEGEDQKEVKLYHSKGSCAARGFSEVLLASFNKQTGRGTIGGLEENIIHLHLQKT